MNVNVPLAELRRLAEESEDGMRRDVAGVVVNLRLMPAEVRRMDALTEQSKRLGLKASEYDELRGYADLTDLLAVLRLRAEDALAGDPAEVPSGAVA